MNLLLLCGNLSYAGAQRQLLELAKALKDAHNVHVCSITSNVPLKKEFKESKINLHILNLRKRNVVKVIIALKNIIQKQKIDVIYSFLETANTYSRIMKLFHPHVKVISSERSSESSVTISKKIIEKLFTKLTNLYIANSFAGKTNLINNFNIDSNNIEVIHNGVDKRRFDKYKSPKLNFNIDGSLIIVIIGRIKPDKNFEMFLDVADNICMKYINVSFIVVGDNSKQNSAYYEKIMIMYNKKVMKKNIHFVGARNDIPSILSISDISILTSYKEGCSNTVLESMFAKCPLVVTDVGDNRLILSEANQNFAVKPNDVEDMVKKISILIEDESLRKEIGKENFAKAVKEFTIEKMASKTEYAITGILAD